MANIAAPTESDMPSQPLATVVAGYVFARRTITWLEQWLTPLFALALRLYLASVFFRAGVVKAMDWDSTVFLFENVYTVPVLPPALAAAMGMGGELVLSTLLACGLVGRFAAAGLFVLNVTAAMSYPDLSELGLADHVLWGALLLVPLFHGLGPWTLDAMLTPRLERRWGLVPR